MSKDHSSKKQKLSDPSEQKMGEFEFVLPDNIQNKSLNVTHKGQCLYENVIGADMDKGWARITPDTPEEVLGLLTTGVEGCTVLIISSPDNRFISMSHDSEVGDDEIESEIEIIKRLSGQDVVNFRAGANFDGEFAEEVKDKAREHETSPEEVLKNDDWMEEIQETMKERVDDLIELIQEYGGTTSPIKMQQHGNICVQRGGAVDLFPDMKEEDLKHNILPSKAVDSKEAEKLGKGVDKSRGV